MRCSTLIQVLIDHGDEVILPVPYWVSFKDIVRYAGGECVLLHSDESRGFRVTAEMVAGLITPRTKVIILNSPSNPSGAVMSAEDLTEVVRLAHERGIWVLSDECYVYLNYTGRNFSVGSLREFKERMVVLGSLSKTYAMTGWRLGYALGPAAVVSAMSKLQSQSTSNPTSIVQKAAVAALKGPQDCVEQMRREYIELRDHAVKGLRAIPGVTCTLPEGAFYAYPNISAFLGRGGVKSGFRRSGKIASRSARGYGAGRGVWHGRTHPRFLCDFEGGVGSRAGTDAEVLCCAVGARFRHMVESGSARPFVRERPFFVGSWVVGLLL